MRYNGIPVGRVAEIKLDPQDPTRVRITIELQGAVVVKSDAVASLELQGLTGGTFINLTGGSRDAPPLTRQSGQRYPVIASRPSGLQQVVTSAPEALARLIALADQLSDVLGDKNRQALSETLDNLRKVTAAAAGHAGEIDSGIADGTAALHDLRTTLDAANGILSALDQMIAPAGAMQETVKSVDDATRKFADVAQHLDAVIAENQPQVRDFTRRGFDQLEQLVTQSQQLVAQLSRIADAVERDPSRFLYGDRRQGYQPAMKRGLEARPVSRPGADGASLFALLAAGCSSILPPPPPPPPLYRLTPTAATQRRRAGARRAARRSTCRRRRPRSTRRASRSRAAPPASIISPTPHGPTARRRCSSR